MQSGRIFWGRPWLRKGCFANDDEVSRNLVKMWKCAIMLEEHFYPSSSLTAIIHSFKSMDDGRQLNIFCKMNEVID
jgi:hypothetical protein